MSKRFGLPETKATRRTRIIISRIGSETVGLIVEQVTEVINLKEDAIEPAPAMAFAVDSRYVEGVGRMETGLIIILDLALLFSEKEMAQLRTQNLA